MLENNKAHVVKVNVIFLTLPLDVYFKKYINKF